jgi:hypothetical protein
MNNYRINDMHTDDRSDITNPRFNPSVSSKSKRDGDKFTQNIDKWIDFLSWAR